MNKEFLEKHLKEVKEFVENAVVSEGEHEFTLLTEHIGCIIYYESGYLEVVVEADGSEIGRNEFDARGWDRVKRFDAVWDYLDSWILLERRA